MQCRVQSARCKVHKVSDIVRRWHDLLYVHCDRSVTSGGYKSLQAEKYTHSILLLIIIKIIIII